MRILSAGKAQAGHCPLEQKDEQGTAGQWVTFMSQDLFLFLFVLNAFIWRLPNNLSQTAKLDSSHDNYYFIDKILCAMHCVLKHCGCFTCLISLNS